MTNALLEEKKKIKEWLQVLEFIKRIYGEDKAEFIRINNYFIIWIFINIV